MAVVWEGPSVALSLLSSASGAERSSSELVSEELADSEGGGDSVPIVQKLVSLMSQSKRVHLYSPED